MDIRQFRLELAETFEAAGFECKKVKGSKATVWVLPGCEVERIFWEDAQRRPWGFILSGSLAIDVPKFRSWLTKRFPKEKRFPKDQHGILWGTLLSVYIANHRDMFFAVETEQPPYRSWVQDIRRRLAALPDTIDALLLAEHQPERLKLVWDKWRAPKAFKYFRAWAIGEPPENPPPYMLPDGRIVDAAVNDPA